MQDRHSFLWKLLFGVCSKAACRCRVEMSATDILDAYIAEQSGGPEGHPLRLLYPRQSGPVTHKSYSFSTHSSQAKSQSQPQQRKALLEKSNDAAGFSLSKRPEGTKPLGPARATAKSAAAALAIRSKAATRNPGRSIQAHTNSARVEPEMGIAKPSTSAPESVPTSRYNFAPASFTTRSVAKDASR